MAARRSTHRVQCSQTGCTECGLYAFDSMRERRESSVFKPGFEWRCVRHSGGAKVLSVADRRTEWESLPSAQSAEYPDHEARFWGSDGFIYGPGFKAWARDFPVGTRIRVTTEIVLPEDSNASK